MVIPIHFDLEQRQDTSGCKLARFFLLIREFILTENLGKIIHNVLVLQLHHSFLLV